MKKQIPTDKPEVAPASNARKQTTKAQRVGGLSPAYIQMMREALEELDEQERREEEEREREEA